MTAAQIATAKRTRTSKQAFTPSVTITRPLAVTPTYTTVDVLGTNGGVVGAVCTFAIATPGIVTWGGGTPAAHGLVAGDAVTFETTGSLPGEITVATVYYVVIPALNPTTTFNLSDTKAHALAGTNLKAFSGAGTATTTCSKLGSGVLTFENCGIPGDMTVIKQALFYSNETGLPANLTGFRLHLYDSYPASDFVDNGAWTLAATDGGYLGYIDIGTPVDVGPSIAVQTGILDKYFTTQTGTLYGYLVVTAGGTVTMLTGSVSTIKLFAVAA